MFTGGILLISRNLLHAALPRALIYQRLRASSRLYEKLRSGSAFPCYARQEDEEEGRFERGRGILLYQASTDFANSYFRDDCGKMNVRKSGSSAENYAIDEDSWSRISRIFIYLFKVDIFNVTVC